MAAKAIAITQSVINIEPGGVKPTIYRSTKLLKKNMYFKSPKILVLGEDDFSFSAKLSQLIGSYKLIWATFEFQAATDEAKNNASSTLTKLFPKDHVHYQIHPHQSIGNLKLLEAAPFDKVIYYNPKGRKQGIRAFITHQKYIITGGGDLQLFTLKVRLIRLWTYKKLLPLWATYRAQGKSPM